MVTTKRVQQSRPQLGLAIVELADASCVCHRVLPDIGEVPVPPDEFIGNARVSRRAASRINGRNSRRKQVFRTENAEPRTS